MNSRLDQMADLPPWQFCAGQQRRCWMVSIWVLLAILLGLQWQPGAGWMLWWQSFSGFDVLAVLALGLWITRQLRAPAPQWGVGCRGGSLLLMLSDPSSAQDHAKELPVSAAVVLPGLIILTLHSRSRRVWVFADECSETTWRRFCLCARFARQDRIAGLG